MIEFTQLLDAYLECRHHKRNSMAALAFEVDLENNLINLYHDIVNGNYRISPSIAFVIEKPVRREVFAADFRDRIVQHLLMQLLIPHLEHEFIYDSYACRTGKGTLHGIKRIRRFIAQCSEGYTKDCYILKCDISGFFMNIDREVLWQKLKEFILSLDFGDRKIEQPVIRDLFAQPVITSELSDLVLSITQQIIKHTLGIRYYGRYVDDFVIIHPDKEFLKTLIPVFEKFLADDLRLTLHPRKRYLQHYSKGVSFLGVWIKYGALHTGKRTKAGAYNAIHKWSKLSNLRLLTPDEMLQFRDSVNSYWGIMQHHHSYHLRKKMTDRFSAQLCNRISCTNYSKIKMQDYTLIGGGRMIPYVEWWRLFDKKEIEKRRNNKRDK